MIDPHPFPLIRSGGLFLILVGIAIVLGAILPRRRWAALALGGGVASAVLALTAVPLVRPLGMPTRPQVVILALAVVLEVAALGWLGRRLRHHGERTRDLASFLVVGVHFLPMGVAFGSLISLLGILTSAAAAAGLSVAIRAPLRLLWACDGVLKIAAGVLMFALAPRF